MGCKHLRTLLKCAANPVEIYNPRCKGCIHYKPEGVHDVEEFYEEESQK